MKLDSGIVDLMESLADHKRLRILRLLEENELGVAELCEVLQSPQSTVSRHLKILGDLGWVHSRKQGTNHLYRGSVDELDSAAKQLWRVDRLQTERWNEVMQDQLRLQTRLQQRSDTEAFFAGAAAEWDSLRSQLYGQHFSAAACLALLPSNTIVADLGCATGPITAQLAPFVSQVIGVDNSPAMLKAAGRRLAEFPNVELRRGDLAAVPIESASCDAAILVLALSYVREPVAVLCEMSRILKPGGRAVVVDLLPHDRDDFRRQFGQRCNGFDLQNIRQWMEESHLKISVARPLATEPQAKGPALFLAAADKN